MESNYIKHNARLTREAANYILKFVICTVHHLNKIELEEQALFAIQENRVRQNHENMKLTKNDVIYMFINNLLKWRKSWTMFMWHFEIIGDIIIWGG